MTAPPGAVASTPACPGAPGWPGWPGAPGNPWAPGWPFTFQVTLRSVFLHFEERRSRPLLAPFFAAQAEIVLGAVARPNAPKAEAAIAPPTARRQTVATTLAYVTRGIRSNV